MDCIVGIANTFGMGLQIPLYQQPERHYERRATPPQPDRTSKVCLPSKPRTKSRPILSLFSIKAFVNLLILCLYVFFFFFFRFISFYNSFLFDSSFDFLLLLNYFFIAVDTLLLRQLREKKKKRLAS